MQIRAVFFDMGGTLQTYGYDRALRLQATPELRRLLVKAGINLPLDDDQLEAVVSSGLERYKRWSISSLVELPSCAVWQDYILPDYQVDPGRLETAAEDLTFYVETRYYRRAMRPEIPAVLEAIRGMGLKIGLISNVSSRGQVPANLEEYGIRHYFDPIVLSSEYGRRKPDPAIFHYAARLANVPTSQCAYIGDRVTRDIEGARRAGFGLAIQIEHDLPDGETDEGATPDAVVKDMHEVLDILRSKVAAHAQYPGKVRAILFDAGDILYYRPQRGQCFKAFLQEMHIEAPEGRVIDKESLTQEAYQGKIDQDQYQEAILHMYGITEPELLQRGKRALKDDENNVEFFEGVQETLVALKEMGYLLGIVTDTANPIHAKLNWFERGGFGHVWDSIISSRELGMRKPDPRIYAAALEQLGVQADQAVFVGHRAVELEGARNAGLQTIAFNYDADAQADYFMERFADLLNVPLLERQGNAAQFGG
jgi:putative hydrolase of the HAD superfamily